MGLRSVHKSPSLPLLPPHSFPVLQSGSFHSLQSFRTNLFQHGLHFLLETATKSRPPNLCSGAWTAPYCSFLSDFGVHATVCHLFFPYSTCPVVLLFITYVLPEAPTSVADGISCVLWWVHWGTIWNQHRASLGLFSQQPLLETHPLPKPGYEPQAWFSWVEIVRDKMNTKAQLACELFYWCRVEKTILIQYKQFHSRDKAST